ncbi:hypothetical protein ACFLSJ_04025 [Verrucomicrobiota bacterium]
MNRPLTLCIALAVLTLYSAGCKAPAPPPRRATDWSPGVRDCTEWALRCDACGKVYAHNKYRLRVPLERHRKWARSQGCLFVEHEGKTYDTCSPECRQSLLRSKGAAAADGDTE